MKSLFFFLFLAIAPAVVFAEVKPSPSPSSGVTYSKMSDRQSLDDMTYEKKMQYRKEREDYNKLVADYNEMLRKKAAGELPSTTVAVAKPVTGQNTKNFNEQRAAEKKKAKLKKKVLIS